MMRIRLYAAMLLVVSSVANADTTYIYSLPYTVPLESQAADLLYDASGGDASFVTGAPCYAGADACVKITPPSVGQVRCGVGNFIFSGITPTVLHIRMMLYFGTSYAVNSTDPDDDDQNKFVIVYPNSGVDARGMTIFEKYDATEYFAPGACQDNTCLWDCGGTPCGGPNGADTFVIGDGVGAGDYAGKWFSFEIRIDTASGGSTVYITTADGLFSGAYLTYPYDPADSDWFSEIQIIGGFFNGDHYADVNSYIMVDEIVVDDELIGPPTGFGVPTPTPTPSPTPSPTPVRASTASGTASRR